MEKGKIKKISLITLLVLLIVGIVIIGVNANNYKSYLVDVVNAKDTQDDIISNDKIQIQKQIVKDNKNQPYYNIKNLTYEVKIKNIVESLNREVALLVDTSYSTPINDDGNLLKTTAKELGTKILQNCPKTSIKLFNARGAIANNVNADQLKSCIDGLIIGDGNDITNGLNVAKTSFSAGDNIDKYVIILTDATDNIKETLKEIDSNEIKVIAISVNNISSNSYDNRVFKMVYNDTYTEEEKVYEELDMDSIIKIINGSLNNIKVTDIFSEALKQFFDFELLTTAENENVQSTDSGYIWNIDCLKSQQEKTLRYRLNIKEGIEITNEQYKYHILPVSDSVTVEYNQKVCNPRNEDINEKLTMTKEDVPTIKICEKYTITFKAVSEENNSLPVSGVKFTVIAKDKDGIVVYNNTLTTDKDGKIVVDNLKAEGLVHFEVKPTVNLAGYGQTDTTEIEISNHNGTGFIVETPEYKDKCTIEEDRRNVTVNIPINTQKFILEVALKELNNANAAIGNTEFRLIQPKLNNKYEMQAQYAETDENGRVIFEPTVMTQAGTYEYILSQMNVQDGYVSMGNATLRITFDKNGKVVQNGIKVIYNDKVTGQRINENHILITAQNSTEKEDMFNLELNLVDSDDSRIKLEGAEYNVEIKRESAGSIATTTYYNNKTNEKGKMLLDLPGTGNIQLKITQVKTKTGYNIDNEPKIITLTRRDGTVTSVNSAYNENTKTSVDAKPYSSENKVIVNLSNKIKNERNMINIKLTDIEEQDVVIPNINITLKNDITGDTYTSTTGIDGIASFQIDNQVAGTYPYSIKVGQLPSIYNVMIDSKISVEFGERETVISVSDLGDSTIADYPLYDGPHTEIVENGEFTDYKADISLGATVNAANTYWFEIRLRDEEDLNIPLEGASYDITITSGDIVRKITGRRTDSSGNIRTRLVLNEDITIEATQVDSTTKYKLDPATKEIALRYVSGRLSLADTEITNVVINENIVIYNHTNAKKTGDDVLLDLTINKEDVNGFVAGGLPIRIYQEDQENNFISTTQGYEVNGTKYGSWLEQSGEIEAPVPFEAGTDLEPGKLNITTNTNSLGTVVLKGLKMNNIPVPGEGSFILYVVEVDKVTNQDKPGTLVKYKITYRYNENKEIIEITNVETTLGNRLVKRTDNDKKTFSGYETAIGYQSNISTTIFTNYDDVGNLALDLNKFDKDGNTLIGAEYEIKVLRPDGSTSIRKITINDYETEVQGLMVTAGSQIEIKEIKAPIGYAINEATETIEVESIDETGEITLKVISNNYPKPRIEIEKIQAYIATTGSLKTEYEVKLTDYELDTFKMKIIGIDAKTKGRVANYSFEINTDKGAIKITNATDNNGVVETLVGGNYKDETVKYEIKTNKKAQYYKDITPFALDIKFDEDERVDISTLTIQTDTNYGELDNGKTWKIAAINVSEGSDIELEVYIEPEDPLEVEIETIDAISGNKITDAAYQIVPSVNLPGTGELDSATQNTIVKVGYVEKGVSKEYTLKTTLPGNYEGLADQTFMVYYDNDGNIQSMPTTTSGTMTIQSFSGKKMVIRNLVEPRQGIQITNTNYFTGESITGASFNVTTEEGRTNTVNMGLLGKGVTLGSQNGEANSTVRYKIHQNAVAEGFATIPDFEIDVKYGANREVTNVELVNDDCKIWVNLSVIKPSTQEDEGYNGNDKGIVKIEIRSYYDFRVNVENVDRLNRYMKITGTKYKITSTENKEGTAETNASGIGTVHLDELKLNKKAVYTIKELTSSIEYQPLEIEQIDVEVEFDENGFVIPGSVKVITGHGDEYAKASGITPVVDTDKFSINVQVTSNPKFRMNIKNMDYFDNTILLNGTKYNITSEIGNSIDNNRVTDSNGEVVLRVNGNPRNKVTYTIHEEKPSAGYQRLEEDIKIEITFNEDGVVKSCEVIQGNRFSSATPKQNILTTFDSFTINVDIKSVELLKFNINNISEEIDADRNPIIKQVAGSQYKISAIEVSANENLNVDSQGVTDLNGKATISMDRALSNKTIKYVISQVQSAAGYKTLDRNIIIQVSFDNDGKVVANSATIITDENGESSNNFAKITNVDINNFEIDLEIKSNKKVDFVINNISTTRDAEGNVVSVDPVRNTTYTISVTEVSENRNLNANNSGTTNGDGKVRISMDRGLANKKIHYTIRETAKSVGYMWQDCETIIEAEFDANGKLIENSIKIVANNEGISANGFVKITNIDIDNYEIFLEIENTPIKEFGIHLVALDMYTDDPIDGVKANAYLAANDIDNYTLQSDGKYDFSVVNKDMETENADFKYLYTGADRDGDGKPDVAQGEDYLSMGEYLEGKNTNRVLRIILRDVPNPYQWYTNTTGSRQDYAIAINVQFDDEGKIIGHSLRTGHSEYIGWQADSRYVTIESTGYGLTVRLKFYPMLHVKMESQDMYTKEIQESRLNLSTSRYYDTTSSTDVIEEGYIGDTWGYYDSYRGSVYSVKSSHNYLRAARTENNRERTFYLYEETIPRQGESYYQKYRPRNYPSSGSKYHQSLIGTIKVIYDEAGKIKDAQVTSYVSSNNIKSGYIDLKWEGYNLDVKVSYAPTTKIVATLVDRVTGAKLNNIKLYPFNNGKIRYEHYEYDKGYESTSSVGTAGWTYWQPNVPGEQNTYVVKTAFNGNEYNGYYLPGDVKLDVAYNETGRIASAQVLSQNIFGDALNAETTWNDTTVNLTIKLDRKFNLKIDKKDIYDSNRNLSVKFDIESNRNETARLNAWSTTTVGRIHTGQTVEYTLSEVEAIDGYVPLKNLKIYVQFNDNGTVERAYVDRSYEKYFEVVRKASAETGKKGINVTDLELIIKNTPTLTVDAELTDLFYNNLKLADATFTITNSKGESASGNLLTNAQGVFSSSVGEVYPNETITYTVKQTSIVSGYMENNSEMEFTVKYTENGNIESYTVTKGSNLFGIKPNIYNGTRRIKLDIKNEPRDVNIGIINLDANTGAGINDIQYKVEIKDVATNRTDTKTYITQSNMDGEGTVSGKVDDVEKSGEPRYVIYRISEINVPNTFRKIQDIEIEVIYNEDGSIRSYDILSNDSEVDVKVYIKGSNIKKLNGIPTHIRLTIKNDNRYDLIIKDEDKNYPSLGVEGTRYDVSINGERQQLPVTDQNGKTGKYKIEGSGEITIRIAENGVGTGYRDDEQNDTTIVLQKGETVYSLALDSNSNPTKADVDVNEETGTVTVTFKNETKLELDLVKNDISTEEALPGIPFRITAQEIDARGNPVGDEVILTETKDDTTDDTTPVDSTDGDSTTEDGTTEDGTTEDEATDEEHEKLLKQSMLTDENGKIHLDLGITPQNKTILYTIKEVEIPEGYDPITEVKVIAKFDMYGHLQELTDNSAETYTTINSNNVNGIVAIIGNKKTDPELPPEAKINPEYKIKVVTEDSVTNRRINGSMFNINVTKEDGTEIVTKESAVTGDIIKNGFLIEKGAIILDGLKEEGNINIAIDQTETAEGYTFSNKTSGTVKINVTYTEVDEVRINDIFISEEDKDGFDVIIDNENREIIVKIKNVPGVNLNINKYYEKYEVTDDKNTIKIEKPAEGVKFQVTSEIQTSTEIITTDLKQETTSTDEEGNTKTTIGEPKAGKTVLYTLKEISSGEFEPIDDIILLVKYDSNGNIKYTEVLSDGDVTKITNDGKGTKELGIRVKNIKNSSNKNYKIILEKHNIEDGEYQFLIPGTEFQITVQEEYGTTRTWTDITNEEGIIESAFFSGYGRIKITYIELTAAEGFERDSNTYEIEVLRDKETGKLSQITTNENYDFEKDDSIIYLKPQNELEKGNYSLMINKVDALNNHRITNNRAEFVVSTIETQVITKNDIDEDGNIIENTEEKEIETEIGTITTNVEGKARIDVIQMPQEEGTYKLKILETGVPEGYEANEEGYFLNVTFTKNVNDKMEITRIENLSEGDIDLLKTTDQLIAINIKNSKKTEDMAENEYMLNITKIDSETKQAITENEAIFKMTDEQGNRSYIETDIYSGILKIPYLTMPDDSEFSTGGSEVSVVQRTYELQEIKAPEGYLVNTNPISVKITFVKDDDNKTVIQNVETTLEGKEIETTIQDRIIKFNVENTEGEVVNNIDRGRYTINIAKIDEETEDPITGHATFVITLENGEKVTASTDENGNIQIKDIKVPATVTSNLGPYSYVIEETRPADGYEAINGYSIMELTFKKLIDPVTGEETGLYGIDNIEKVPVLTQSQSAVITSYTEEEVNITITNKIGVRTIKYDANCDDETVVVPEPQIKIQDQDLTLDTLEPEREGYVFEGWATTRDAEEAEYQPGDTFTKDEDTTLYAIWNDKLFIKSDEYKIVDATLQKKGLFNDIIYNTANESEYGDGDKFILGIIPRTYQFGTSAEKDVKGGTSVTDFIGNLETNANTIKVTKKQYNSSRTELIDVEISGDELVGTGMTVEFIKGKQSVKLETVVPGDLTNGRDGESGDGIWKGNDSTVIMAGTGANGAELEKIKQKGQSFVLALDVRMDKNIKNTDRTVFLHHFNQKSISDLKQIWPNNN